MPPIQTIVIYAKNYT